MLKEKSSSNQCCKVILMDYNTVLEFHTLIAFITFYSCIMTKAESAYYENFF